MGKWSGMKAKLGQNFLLDESVLQLEAESAGVKGKSVLEIGAGDGRLTAKLLSQGAGHITAVEIDPKLAKSLRMKFRSRVLVVEGDFLDFSPKKKYNCVVGNIPYYITSPILLKLASMDFDLAILCIQKEVAERMVAPPGTGGYGRLSVSCQLSFRAKIICGVGREAFSPMPRVDSCIISLSKTGFAASEGQQKAIAAIFSHRKKSLKNAVVDGRMQLFGCSDKAFALQAAQTLKYKERKVFTLSPKEVLESVGQLVV
jgi:ribosomal RNA small subunit methyltransferase A